MALTLRGNGQILSDNYVIDSDGTADFVGNDVTDNVTIRTSHTAATNTGLVVHNGTAPSSFYPSGNWSAKVFNEFDDSSAGGLVVGNRWAAQESTAFEVGTMFNAWVPALTVNGLGHVNTPRNPSFFVKDLTYSTSGGSNGTGGTVLHNIGSHYNTSTGAFTAPVAGVYYFYGSIQMFTSGSSTYVGLEFNKNGTQYGIEFVSGNVTNSGHYNDHHTQEGGIVIPLNRNDYVNIEANRGARNGVQNVFMGYLIG